jgi:hypothetical protein
VLRNGRTLISGVGRSVRTELNGSLRAGKGSQFVLLDKFARARHKANACYVDGILTPLSRTRLPIRLFVMYCPDRVQLAMCFWGT